MEGEADAEGRAEPLLALDLDALVHDVGKLTLPQRILDGEGPLSDVEWELIRRHPSHGAGIVARLGCGEEVVAIVAAHHERIDEGGYPRGLKGAEIPTIARIIAVADAYDAMTARDSYRRQLPRSRLAGAS